MCSVVTQSAARDLPHVIVICEVHLTKLLSVTQRAAIAVPIVILRPRHFMTHKPSRVCYGRFCYL